MKILQFPIVATLCSMLCIIPMSGCSVSQAKINTVVQDIATYAPIISTDATSLATIIQGFDPADAALIQKSVLTLQTDSASLTILCNQYLTAPSKSLLTQISATVSDLATVDSDALLAVLQVKNPQSLIQAKLVLVGIATAVTILSAYLASVNVQVTPSASQSIKTMAPYVKKSVLVSELDKAKSQGLVPENTNLEVFGF